MRGQLSCSLGWSKFIASKSLAIWESDDLVNWTEQRLAKIGDEQFGCLWAQMLFINKRQKIMLCTGLLL